MSPEESKAYAKKLLLESGVSEEEATQTTDKLFANAKFAQGFIPRPEVDRSLDAERQKSKAHADRNAYLETEWLPSAKRAEAQAHAIIGKYNQYVTTYGDIDAADPNAVRQGAATMGLSEDKVRELMQKDLSAALTARDRNVLDLMDIREDHMATFNKRLNLSEFEKYVDDQRRAGNGDSLKAVYHSWIGPEVEKLTPHRFSDDDLKARDKRIAEEAQKDFASRNRIPIDARPKEAHLLFDRLATTDGKAGGTPPKSGKDAFFEVFNDPNPDTVRQRYPV